MIGRLIILAATVGGGLFLGRKKINAEIEKKLPGEIEAARELAIAELDRKAGEIIGERLLAFVLSLLIKAGLIGAVYWFFAVGYLSASGLKVAGAVLIVGFIARDIFNLAPIALQAFRLLKDAHWNVRLALTELIADVTFKRAYVQAMVQTGQGPQSSFLKFSRYTPEGIATEIATAVAEVARKTTFDLVKVRAIIAIVTAAAMLSAYWAFFSLTIGVG